MKTSKFEKLIVLEWILLIFNFLFSGIRKGFGVKKMKNINIFEQFNKRSSFIILALLFSHHISYGQNKYDLYNYFMNCDKGDSLSCTTLLEIAENDKKDYDIRLKAIEYISHLPKSQDLLEKIVKSTKDIYIIRAAITYISNDSILIRIAKNNENILARQVSINKIKSQDVLIEIIKTDKEEAVRREALKKIDDDNILIQFAQHSKDKFIRSDAAVRINNQSILTNLAYNDLDDIVRQAAVSKINDENILYDIIKKEKNELTRLYAIYGIKDQNILLNIATSETSLLVCNEAIKKISDQNILLTIAKNNKCVAHSSAVRKINDQTVLGEIATKDTEKSNRYVATEKLVDQNVLGTIALNEKENYIRMIAISRIENQFILGNIVIENENQEIAVAAFDKIRDNIIRKRIATLKKDISFSLKYLFNDLDEKQYKEILTSIMNRDVSNSSGLAALKLIPYDTILSKYYEYIRINVDLYKNYKTYKSDYWVHAQIKLGELKWYYLDFKIKINTNKDNKNFDFTGDRGNESYRYSEGELDQVVAKIKKVHEGEIKIKEICKYLLEPVTKTDLAKIAQNSEVKYLRESAKQLLSN